MTRRWLLVVALALLTTGPLARALASCASLVAGEMGTWFAILDVLQAALALMLALAIVALVDGGPRHRLRPLWLLDWRATIVRRLASGDGDGGAHVHSRSYPHGGQGSATRT